VNLVLSPHRRAITRTAIVVILVVVIALAAVGAYYATSGPKTSTSTTTSQNSTSSTSSSTSSSVTPSFTTTTSTTSSPVKNTLVAEEQNQPDTLDPAVTYVTPGWEVVDQVYQGLVTYDGSSTTDFVGVLAQSWTVSPDGMNYTFILRSGVTFSNGDPFNAYVMWYSVYRTIVMTQAPYWIVAQNLAAGNGRTFNVSDAMLNSINYASPSAANLIDMENPHQSVQVLNSSAIRFNLGYGSNGMSPYSQFLATLETPMAMAIDPLFVLSHGGVTAGRPNGDMTTSTMGTGFYELQSWVPGQSASLVKNPNYWGNTVPRSKLNSATYPAIINNIIIYYKPAAASIADLRSGAAQIVFVPVTYYNVTAGMTGVTTKVLSPAFGAAEAVTYLYMDPMAFAPFNNTLVREAISNGINYQVIIKTVFASHAIQWVGPVPPGFPYYNESTAGLSPYQYNATKAAELLAQAGYVSHLPDGTTLNPGGSPFPVVNFLYDSDSPTDTQAAEIIASNLGTIGIPVALAPLPYQQYTGVIYSGASNTTSYPMGIGYYSEDYTASIDYVYYFTSDNYIGTSDYSNSTVISWTGNASASFNNAVVISDFRNITSAMYSSYTNVWLYVAEMMTVNQNGVTGMIPNFAGSGAGYFLYYNTVTYSS
jgi:peptide/nickel transport system substrate-binding protein